jgi:hypothetical protein
MKKRRKRARPSVARNALIGVAWYTPEQWARLKEIAADSDEMGSSHEEWEAGAEKLMVNLARAGVLARRFDVDVEELDAWCRSRQRPNNRAERADFVAHRLEEQHRQERSLSEAQEFPFIGGES